MTSPKYNVVVLGVCCFEGMASSMRVRNLINPLLDQNVIQVYNLIYAGSYEGNTIPEQGTAGKVKFDVIGFRFTRFVSVFRFLFKGMELIKKHKSRSLKNIIYNYDYPDIKNIIFLLFAKAIGYKIVFDIVEDNKFVANHSGVLNRLRMKSSRVLLNSSVYFANAYIAISSHLYNKLELLTSRREKVHLIPICVDLKFFSNKLYLHDKNNIKIFYGGSYGQKDGLSYLVAAFDKLSARHDNIHLILSGKGFPSDMDLLFDQISKLRSKEKIIYKGYLDTNDYYSLVNDCDIFCMTRITSKAATTGFPFKLGEFLATGKAVVATNIGEVSRYLKNGHNALLIRSESVDDIVNALQQLVENPDLIETLGTEGRKTAETCFDSDKLSLQVLRIFETI